MTVLSRGARVRRGGRRPGWVLLTALLVLAIGASSALVFTNRVELLKLAVILALWAAVAGAFVSVLYRRQSDADQARARDMKLVYDLQLEREISARREYELTVESQLRRELASELRAQSADEVAALRAELSSLRTSLEILFDTDLEHRPALETVEREAAIARGLSDWSQNGEGPPADWVSSDRVTAVPDRDALTRTDENPIIDVSEVGVPPASEGPPLPPRRPTVAREEPASERVRVQWDAQPGPPPPQPEPVFEPRHRPPPQPPPPPEPSGWPAPPAAWQPAPADGQWLPHGAPGSNWVAADETNAPAGRRRRARHSSREEQLDGMPDVDPARQYAEPGRRSPSRHSSEYRDYGPGGPGSPGLGEPAPPPPPQAPGPAAAPPPRLAPPPLPEPTPRHRSADQEAEVPDRSRDSGTSRRDPESGGQSVADLMARLQHQPTGGGRRRRREG
jgi:hypothetical protein